MSCCCGWCYVHICIYACLYICMILLRVCLSTSYLHSIVSSFFFDVRLVRVRVRVRVRHWWYATGLGLGLVGEYKTYRILGVWTWKFGMLKVYVYVNDKNRFKSMTSTQKKYLPLGWLRRQNVFSLRINGNRMNIFSHFFSEFGAINPHVHQSMFILNIRNGFRGQMFVEFLGRIWVGI